MATHVQTVQVEARFENGVFVPRTKVDLPDHEEVILRFELPLATSDAADSDPRPSGGPELVEWRARHRLTGDPEIMRQIAEDPEFDIENS